MSPDKKRPLYLLTLQPFFLSRKDSDKRVPQAFDLPISFFVSQKKGSSFCYRIPYGQCHIIPLQFFLFSIMSRLLRGLSYSATLFYRFTPHIFSRSSVVDRRISLNRFSYHVSTHRIGLRVVLWSLGTFVCRSPSINPTALQPEDPLLKKRHPYALPKMKVPPQRALLSRVSLFFDV